MDNAGRPNETDMIDGEPYSLWDLEDMEIHDPDFWIWYENLSPMGKTTVSRMLWGEDPQEAD